MRDNPSTGWEDWLQYRLMYNWISCILFWRAVFYIAWYKRSGRVFGAHSMESWFHYRTNKSSIYFSGWIANKNNSKNWANSLKEQSLKGPLTMTHIGTQSVLEIFCNVFSMRNVSTRCVTWNLLRTGWEIITEYRDVISVIDMGKRVCECGFSSPFTVSERTVCVMMTALGEK